MLHQKICNRRTPIPTSAFTQLLAVFVQEWQAVAALLVRVTAWATHRPLRGMYEILRYESELELVDPAGHLAIFRKRQRVRFLQDNIIAFQDYAWGDGDLFAGYHCAPGVAVDRYQDGDRWNILISLRATQSRGDVIDFRSERAVRDGFGQTEEWCQVEIRHATRQLRLSILFPATRPCRQASVHARKHNHTDVLEPAHIQRLPDGRQRVEWETHQVRHLEIYTLRWTW
jgi:hypothetical protein